MLGIRIVNLVELRHYTDIDRSDKNEDPEYREFANR